MTSNMEYGKHGRCRAIAKTTGERCGRAAVGPHGKCDKHGGDSLKGEESPQFKHGLFSDYLSEEDRRAINALEDADDVEKLDDLINWRLARLRRYLRRMSEDDRADFFEKFDMMVREGARNGEPGLSAKQIGELGKTLSQHNRAAQAEIDLVRKLIKDRNKIAEGDTVNVEHSGAIDGERTLGDDEKTMLRDALDPGSDA